MRIRPLLAWYDLWVGVFFDRQKRRVYVLPFPCIGIVIEFDYNPITCDRCGQPFKLFSAGETLCRKCRELLAERIEENGACHNWRELI